MTATMGGRSDAPDTSGVEREIGDLKEQGSHLLDDAKNEVRKLAAQRKDDAASFLRDISDALHNVTSKLDEQGHGRAARYAEAAADKLKSVGDDLPRRDMGELLRQVDTLARERPAIFVSALFVIGFSAARFLKASGREAQPAYVREPATPIIRAGRRSLIRERPIMLDEDRLHDGPDDPRRDRHGCARRSVVSDGSDVGPGERRVDCCSARRSGWRRPRARRRSPRR